MLLRLLTIATLLGSSVLVSGCAPPQSEFSLSTQTESLIPEARQEVVKAIEDYFGGPEASVASLELPVEFGREAGTVGRVEDGDRDFAVNFDAEGDLGDLSGLAVQFSSGSLSEGDVGALHVGAYDAEAGRLAIQEAGGKPAEGDTFSVIGGTLRNGRRLYAEHCQHCHGVSGDGNGPTAKYLNPLPRDYRMGVFKFTSTLRNDRPTRDDLARVIRYGIPGTYMPSFMLLEDEDATAIIEYIRWLAMRGEFERFLLAELPDGFTEEAFAERIEDGETREDILAELSDIDWQQTATDVLERVAGDWSRVDGDSQIVTPTMAKREPTRESILRGRALFLSNKAKCAACHGEGGLGDGPQTELINKNAQNEDYPEPGLFDDWGNAIRPRNLTLGIYRGGRRPLDLYRRIHQGVKGTPMTAFGGVLKEDEIWDLVNYVMSVPFDGPFPADGEELPIVEPPADAGAEGVSPGEDNGPGEDDESAAAGEER